MSTAPRSVSIALAVGLALPPHVSGGQHLVEGPEVTARLHAAANERRSNQRRVDRILGSPLAAEAARARGLDIGKLRAGLAALRDEELRDLAARADALETDPVAGGKKKALIIVGIVVLVGVLLAILIVESCKEQGAECLDKE